MVISGSYLSLPALLRTASVPHLQMCERAWKHAFLLLRTRKELVCTNYRWGVFFCLFVCFLPFPLASISSPWEAYISG